MEYTERQERIPPRRRVAYVSLFGEFRLTAADGTAILISSRRAKALLAMLCLARDESFDRDYLSKVLWPGRFEAHSKASLRQCLLDLGKLLTPFEGNFLEVTRSRVGLNAALVQTDLGELEAALIGQRYAEAAKQLAEIGAQPLLDRMDLGDAFNGWLAKQRHDAELRLRTGIRAGLAALEQAGDRAEHDRLADALALRDPSAERSAGSGLASSAARIAVLPFKPVGGQETADYFADGMADELITTLGQVPQLLVAGRTSSFHFRDSELQAPGIASALGVSYLIEGSVQRQGEQIRIHVHLVDGSAGFELWGERFDGTLNDLFALQEAVAQAVTVAIGGALGIKMQPPLVRGITLSQAAYDLYLQGRSLCAQVFGDGILDKAIALFEAALALDPDFAECWVWLAEAHQLVAVYTQCPDRNAASLRMADCARRAIALSPELGYAYSLLGVHQWTQNDIVGALDYAFEAYRREPENPAVTMRLGSFLLYCGRTHDATAFVTAAIDQDPIDPRKYALMWAIHAGCGDFEAASAAGQRMVDLGWPSTLVALASSMLGQHDLAIEQYLQSKRLVNSMILPPLGSGVMPPEAMDAYWLVAAKGICGGQEADRQIYYQWLEMMAATLHDKADLAITAPAVFTGNAQLAFKTLGHNISPANTIAFLALWVDVDPIRQVWQHPEFIPFAQRIGMAAAWDKYGWPDLLPPPSNLHL